MDVECVLGHIHAGMQLSSDRASPRFTCHLKRVAFATMLMTAPKKVVVQSRIYKHRDLKHAPRSAMA